AWDLDRHERSVVSAGRRPSIPGPVDGARLHRAVHRDPQPHPRLLHHSRADQPGGVGLPAAAEAHGGSRVPTLYVPVTSSCRPERPEPPEQGESPQEIQPKTRIDGGTSVALMTADNGSVSSSCESSPRSLRRRVRGAGIAANAVG